MTTNVLPIDPTENANPAIEAEQFGTVIHITVTDENLATVVEAGFQRMVVERSIDGGLSFNEITVPSERPVLEGTVVSFFDRSGDPSYIYRTRYINEATGELTQASESVDGIGLAIRGILTVPQFKGRYFFGVDITDDQGNPLSDAVFQHYILQAIRWFEHQIDIPILPTTFCDKHDYYREDFHAFNFIRLDNYPLISVEEFRVQYPSGQNVIVFPNEWVRINKPEGHVQIVPTAGTLSEILVGQGGSFLPAIYNGLAYLPQLFEISYTAGFEEGKVPANIVDLIGMFASLGPFNIFGDLIAGAGIANISLSMDGLSQNIGTTSSATNSGYGARIIQYQKQIKEQIPHLRRYYKGTRMVVA
jgi:hypothetical protein